MATTDIDQLGYEEIMPRIGELAGELLSHPDDDAAALGLGRLFGHRTRILNIATPPPY